MAIESTVRSPLHPVLTGSRADFDRWLAQSARDPRGDNGYVQSMPGDRPLFTVMDAVERHELPAREGYERLMALLPVFGATEVFNGAAEPFVEMTSAFAQLAEVSPWTTPPMDWQYHRLAEAFLQHKLVVIHPKTENNPLSPMLRLMAEQPLRRGSWLRTFKRVFAGIRDDDRERLIQWKDYDSETLLHEAVRLGLIEVVQFLATQPHFDPVAGNDYDSTPLSMAIRGHHAPVVRFLESLGARPTPDCPLPVTRHDFVWATHFGIGSDDLALKALAMKANQIPGRLFEKLWTDMTRRGRQPDGMFWLLIHGSLWHTTHHHTNPRPRGPRDSRLDFLADTIPPEWWSRIHGRLDPALLPELVVLEHCIRQKRAPTDTPLNTLPPALQEGVRTRVAARLRAQLAKQIPPAHPQTPPIPGHGRVRL